MVADAFSSIGIHSEREAGRKGTHSVLQFDPILMQLQAELRRIDALIRHFALEEAQVCLADIRDVPRHTQDEKPR